MLVVGGSMGSGIGEDYVVTNTHTFLKIIIKFILPINCNILIVTHTHTISKLQYKKFYTICITKHSPTYL